MTLQETLQEIMDAAGKATKGPWHADGEFVQEADMTIAETEYAKDARFLALCSPEKILALCTALLKADEAFKDITNHTNTTIHGAGNGVTAAERHLFTTWDLKEKARLARAEIAKLIGEK